MNRLNRPPVQPLDSLASYHADNENVRPGFSSPAPIRSSSYPLRTNLPFICLTNTSHLVNDSLDLLINLTDIKHTYLEPSYPVASFHRVSRASEWFDQVIDLPGYDPSPSNHENASRIDSNPTIAFPTFPIVVPSTTQPPRVETRAITPVDVTPPPVASSFYVQTERRLVIDERSKVTEEATDSRKHRVEQVTAGPSELRGEGQRRHEVGGVGEGE